MRRRTTQVAGLDLFAADLLRETRQQAIFAMSQAEEKRIAEELNQRSALWTPEERIRLWEKRHQLSLPESGAHALNNVIASQTCLTIAQVREEAARRATQSRVELATAVR